MIDVDGGPLHQWDTGRTVTFSGPEGAYVNFAVRGMEEAWALESDGLSARVPDELLQLGSDLMVWTFADGKTVERARFRVHPRPRPVGYTFTPTELVTVEKLKQWVKDQLAAGGGIASAQAETLEPGQDATASLESGVLTIGVPRGEPGTRVGVGSGAPAIGGNLGDLYIDGDTGEMYEYARRD